MKKSENRAFYSESHIIEKEIKNYYNYHGTSPESLRKKKLRKCEKKVKKIFKFLQIAMLAAWFFLYIRKIHKKKH